MAINSGNFIIGSQPPAPQKEVQREVITGRPISSLARVYTPPKNRTVPPIKVGVGEHAVQKQSQYLADIMTVEK